MAAISHGAKSLVTITTYGVPLIERFKTCFQEESPFPYGSTLRSKKSYTQMAILFAQVYYINITR